MVELLEASSIAYALIGAVAVGRYGVARATMDVDFFVINSSVLKPEVWSSLGKTVQVDCRRGDFEEPLRGLVACETSRDRLLMSSLESGNGRRASSIVPSPQQCGDDQFQWPVLPT